MKVPAGKKNHCATEYPQAVEDGFCAKDYFHKFQYKRAFHSASERNPSTNVLILCTLCLNLQWVWRYGAKAHVEEAHANYVGAGANTQSQWRLTTATKQQLITVTQIERNRVLSCNKYTTK